MSEASDTHRLSGLEPDNLLAFLTLLGLLRSLEAADRSQTGKVRVRPRAFWDIDKAPLRPVLRLANPVTVAGVAEQAAEGIAMLATDYDFIGRKDLNYAGGEAREILEQAASVASPCERSKADLLSALMSDAAIKNEKNSDEAAVDPTPLCLLFGQGHQHFLERLSEVPHESAPPARGRGKTAVALSAGDCVAEALFSPWHRSDPTASFRWDPNEDVRYALLPGDPTDAAYKGGTQHGANRLAAIGIGALPVAPQTRGRRVRPAIPGGVSSVGGFSFRWPIWRQPATLAAIRAMLSHPGLGDKRVSESLGIAYVLTARRISVGKFMNFTRGRV
jgi:hypothetical protein